EQGRTTNVSGLVAAGTAWARTEINANANRETTRRIRLMCGNLLVAGETTRPPHLGRPPSSATALAKDDARPIPDQRGGATATPSRIEASTFRSAGLTRW